jgi:ABC-2 type transport system ATP-binding protein
VGAAGAVVAADGLVAAMAALQARGLVKRFGDVLAVDGVDVTLVPGEVRGLLGPNGAGKSTLLRILLGLVAADAGAVELFDRPAKGWGGAVPESLGGFVEEPTFYPYLSGRANLEVLAELDGDGAHAPLDAVLARVGLAQSASQRVSGYSTGMRQRLGIAAALLRRPKLLLLDEPTSGLDPAGARDVRELLRDLAAQGIAVLLSSHLIGEVHDVCDTYTVLRRGRVVWSGTHAELQAQAPASAYRLNTSDDRLALELARDRAGVAAEPAETGAWLALRASTSGLDDYVLVLGRAGVAVRRLEQVVSPLELMFFSLTESGP